MTLQNTRVFVNGAGGFIGSHLVERLLGEGATVRAFVRCNGRGDVGHLKHLAREPRLELVAGDLRDPHAVAEAMWGAGLVFHLGALIAIRYSYVHPREVVETNIRSGLLVPPGDSQALADGLHQLLCTPGLGAELGRAAQAKYVQRFILRHRVEAFVELYTQADQRC